MGYVAVLPLWNGNGTVKVILAGEDKLPVGEPICTAVAAHIEEERPLSLIHIWPNITTPWPNTTVSKIHI